MAVAQELSAPEQRIVQLINQARIAQGLGPLVLTPELTAMASEMNRSDIDTLLSRWAKLFESRPSSKTPWLWRS